MLLTQLYPLLSRLLHDEDGATTAEYALTAVFIGMAALVIFVLFPDAIRAYLDRIYFVVTLPVP